MTATFDPPPAPLRAGAADPAAPDQGCAEPRSAGPAPPSLLALAFEADRRLREVRELLRRVAFLAREGERSGRALEACGAILEEIDKAWRD